MPAPLAPLQQLAAGDGGAAMLHSTPSASCAEGMLQQLQEARLLRPRQRSGGPVCAMQICWAQVVRLRSQKSKDCKLFTEMSHRVCNKQCHFTLFGERFSPDASQPESMLCCRFSWALDWQSVAPWLPKEALLLPSMPSGAQLRFLDFTGAVWHSSGKLVGATSLFRALHVDRLKGVRACRWPLL